MNGKVLYVRLAAHLGDLGPGLNRGAAMVSAYGAKVDSTMLRIDRYAEKNKQALDSLATGSARVGLGAAAVVGLAIYKYAQFEKQMSAVQAATHASAEEMAALRAEAIKQGADTQFSAVEAGQGIEELAKAGVATADILGGGLKGALDLAAAGELEVGQAAEIAATAMTQFNLSGKDIPHLADLLAAGAGKAQGSVTDLGAALNQSGLIASGMGLSIEDTTGTLAAFAASGMLGSDAGTSFKTMLQRLQAPMGRGAAAMKEYGISAYDAQGNFVGITDVAEQLRTKLGGLTQAQRDAALAQIFGSDAIRGATVLYNKGARGIQGWIDRTNDQNYAAETAAMRTDNLAGDIERLGGSLDSLFIGLGSGANGPMRQFVQGLEGIVDIAGAVPAPLQSAAIAGLALVAALAATVFVATKVVGAVGSTRAGIALLQAEAWRAAAGVGAMNKSLMVTRGLKGAAVLGGLALATSDVADGFSLANTATYALLGAIGGPMGMALGAAAGLIMDVASSTDDMASAFERAQAKIGSAGNFSGQIRGLEQLRQAQEKNVDQLMKDGSAKWMGKNPLATLKIGFQQATGQDNIFEQQEKDLAAAERAAGRYQGAVQMLEDRTVGANDGVNELFDPKRMQRFVDQIGPVLKNAGLDMEEVFSEGVSGDKWDTAVAVIKEWKAEADTAQGKTTALGAAFAGLDDDMLTTADSAKSLQEALDALLSPNMDLDAATQKWRDSLGQLDNKLRENGTSLSNQTIKGRANREAIRDQIDALTGQITAAAEAGESSDQLATRLDRGRQAMVDQAVAAGLNGEKLNDLLTYYGLTPELVETIVQQTGAEGAAESVGALGDAVARVPADLQTRVATAGAEASKADVEALAVAYGQTPEQVMTTLLARDVASGKIKIVDGKLVTLNGKVARPSVRVDTSQVAAAVRAAQRTIDGMNGKTVRIAVKGGLGGGQTTNAFGSFVPGTTGGRSIVPRYARGAYTEAHMVRAGIPRGMYGEPETLGESYIPHAQDRRKRSTQILGETAKKFGYDLSPRGMQSAGSGRQVVVVQAGAPMVGSLTMQAATKAEAREQMGVAVTELRRLTRGGRWNQG